MWNLVRRAGMDLVRTTTGRRLYSSRDTKMIAYLRDLSCLTRDPLWRLVTALHSPQHISLAEALDAHNVAHDDFVRWRPSLYASDIDKAIEIKQVPSLSAFPSWLSIYLAGFKVRTPEHASGSLMDLTFAHIDVASPAIQGPLLVITMMHLARFDLLRPMQRVVDAFVSVPLTQFQSMHFNHFLGAMKLIRQRSPQTGENAVKILRTMEARQLRLWPRTCSALLEDRHAALQLTTYLQRRITRLGVVPTASQLESYLRVYSADGAIHDAKRYADAIRTLWRAPSAKGSAEEQASTHANRVNRANRLLVRSQPDSVSAFEFLQGLVAKSTRDRPFVARHLSTHPRPLLGKRAVDVSDWSAALSVAAHDLTVDAKSLIRLFMRARPKTSEFRATATTHTILIRGLLLREEWQLAYVYWTKLARSGLPIDNIALATGVRATTLNGRPDEAFALLEAHAARADAQLSVPYRLRVPVKITPGIINKFMASLLRILRPDLIFRLWDTMEELYYARPSSETLRIMLEAAQLPHTLDDSFSGQMALLALKNPFRHPPIPHANRAALFQSITEQAAAPYRSGVWRDCPATETASRIFVQVALGSPERLHIATLEPPAQAVRAHAESDHAAPTLRLDMPPSRFALPNDVLTRAGRARYPELVLRERDWAAYIMFLGMTRRAPEIARVLVWMRALGVQPEPRTLGVALAFWGEVSLQPPLIAAMAGREGNEYLKLVQWLREWCGEVPDELTVGRWHARISQVRTQRRESVTTGRFMDEEHIWSM
ncbi:hypothetical protein GGX14DRAFT_663496 [Mycena pura]|uniref:Uncharacterized protein n=1 Tax=Mycena pura TaxID=153505 RepID=A0AAD6YKV9_9AGAR|nr:hypothetical protein GGX14DRAFT_663496 [Mycena pura]